MNSTMMSYVIIGFVCLCCAAGTMEAYAAVPSGKPAEQGLKLPAVIAGQWECRSVGPFGISSISWQPGMHVRTNGVWKLVNTSTARIHAVYTNIVLSGDFTVKTRFKGGSFIGLVKADKTKGILGLQVMGGSPHTLEIMRVGSEVTMLLDGQSFSYRNYGVKKTDSFMFGVILNKKKACELSGFECKTGNMPLKKTVTAPAEKRTEKAVEIKK